MRKLEIEVINMISVYFSKQEMLTLKQASNKKHLIESLLVDHVNEDEITSFFTGITKILLAPSSANVTLELDSIESSILRDLTQNFLLSEGLEEKKVNKSMNTNDLGKVLEKISEKLFE